MNRYNDSECIGSVIVDSGVLRIGDPCYPESEVSWEEVCERLSETAKIECEGYDEPYGKGIALLIGTGMDGEFPVHVVRNKWGGIREIRIVMVAAHPKAITER